MKPGIPTIAVALALLLAPSAAHAASASPPLAQGKHGEYSWSVRAFQPSAPRPTSELCIRVSITHHHGPFDFDRSRFRDCAAPGGLRRSGPPLLAGGTHLGNPGESSMTVFTLAVPTAVQSLRVSLLDGDQETLQASPPESSRTGLGQTRFAVLAVPGATCVQHLATLNAAQATLWQGLPPDYVCSG